MNRTLRTTADLAAAQLIRPQQAEALVPVAERYAIAITPAMRALIDASDPADPIVRQFVPSLAELNQTPDERADPIGDLVHSPVKGIVHRYPDRVLLKLTHTCPVYCRFCFRREMVGPGGEGALTSAELDAALAYVSARPDIREVILTGGDPFVLSARRIRETTARIAGISNVRVIRWHTRVPIVDPEKVTPAFIAALTQPAPGKAVYVAIHANHAREFTAAARTAIGRLADAGVALISQSVLLAGVNDSVDALADLMRAFVENRVKPYYLHHLDPAPGTSHFRVPIGAGLALVAALRGVVSGLMQPSYVVDIPGGYGKTPLVEARRLPEGDFEIADRKGGLHILPGDSRRAVF